MARRGEARRGRTMNYPVASSFSCSPSQGRK
jgi:hypothetical protein